MTEKKCSNKKRICLLIDRYLRKEISEEEFCSEFFTLYDLEIETNCLSDIEKRTFDKVNLLVNDYWGNKEEEESFPPESKSLANFRQTIEMAKRTLEEQDIYENNDKRKLYWLIKRYLSGNIDESTFCDKFYYSYSLGIDPNELSSIEKKAFNDLDKVVSRFSPYIADHQLDPKAFSTVEELRKSIKETQTLLPPNTIYET